jgi:hypothetical protein
MPNNLRVMIYESLRVLLKFLFWTDQSNLTNSKISPHLEMENSGRFEYQHCRELCNLSKECLNSRFGHIMKKLQTLEVDINFWI